MSAARRRVSRGAGKLILFGEHAVVYGVPAIVAGLPVGATGWAEGSSDYSLTLNDGRRGVVLAQVRRVPGGEALERAFDALLTSLGITQPVSVHVTIDVPIGSGMGSSAAMATAAARALRGFALADDDAFVDSAVAASERVFHGNPSGIDAAAATRGGVLRFERGANETKISKLALSKTLYLGICEAGPAASTAEMVTRVASLKSREPSLFNALTATIESLVSEATRALATGDLGKLGELANINQGILNALGVSTPELERACFSAREAGAFGAKLTGSGGGGCVFAFADQTTIGLVLDRWTHDGFSCFQVVLDPH